MVDEELAAYARALGAVLGLPIPPEDLAAVVEHLARTGDAAALVAAFPLSPGEESDLRFAPGSPLPWGDGDG